MLHLLHPPPAADNGDEDVLALFGPWPSVLRVLRPCFQHLRGTAVSASQRAFTSGSVRGPIVWPRSVRERRGPVRRGPVRRGPIRRGPIRRGPIRRRSQLARRGARAALHARRRRPQHARRGRS